MEKKFYGHANKSGVYRITNITSGKIYIGSAKCFKKRAYQHESRLKNGKHHNKHLLASFKKHGTDAFLFEVLEVVEGDRLIRTTKEQEYLDEQIELENWENCFNFSKKPVQTQGPWSKTPEETRKGISKTKKDFYKTEEGKALIKKLSNDKCGKTYEEYYGEERAAEIKKKISENKLIEMNRPEVKENLRKLLSGVSEIERYGYEKAMEIKKKKSLARKGKYLGKESSRYRVIENICLVSSAGIIYNKIDGIKEFALQNGLSPNHLCELLSGKRKSHKGWKVIL